MRDEDQPPSAEPGDEHPFDELVASGPPATPEEFIKLVSMYLLSLRTIAATQADPAVASQQALEVTTRLIAGLSPAGSSGPVHLFAPLMEVLLARQTGASLDKTVLFKAARRRGKGRPPDQPALVLGKARAAAVMTLLMESGTPEKKAARLVANRLQRAGVKFDRANANPINNIKRAGRLVKG